MTSPVSGVLLLIVSVTALVVACAAFFRAVYDSYVLRRDRDRLYQDLESLRRNLRLRTQLANEIAHDIKNPLTAIVCSAEALDLLIGSKLEGTHRESLRYVREYGAGLLQLMNDFIDVNRAEAGLLKSSPEVVNVSRIAKSVVGLLDAFAERRGVSITPSREELNLSAMVDPKHLKQIVFNLVHNAIKFTHSGGEVRIVVRSCFPEPYLCVEVQDNGRGIPAELLPKIFDPYLCIGQSESGLDSGAGLGLALCKQLVALAGGKIEVRSEPGVGSVFSFLLPAAAESRAEPNADIERISGEHTPLSGQRVLIVDNDGGSREAISRLIEAWGGIADRVSEAADAIEALSRTEYHALVIDGERDPVAVEELARLVKEDLRQETTIILSAQGKADATQLTNVDKIVEKPFHGEELLSSLLSPHSGQKLH